MTDRIREQWFKVTKPNGESFHTPDVVYELGKRVRPLPSDARELCGPGYLHASPSAPEAARYGQWPYRLWRVEGKPYVTQKDKAGFKQLTVVEERPVAECFGPNGVRVVALLERVSRITKTEAEQLYAARDAAWGAAWGAAWDAAWDVVGDAARDAAWYAAWVAVGYAARYYAVRGAARDAARVAARNAAEALVVEDLIGSHGFTQDHFDVLAGPWREAIGEPF